MKEAFFQDKFVPFDQAKISIMTHAFNYGTAVFEGIRGYWNKNKKQMYLFRLKEHYKRLFSSAQVLAIDIIFPLKDLCKITVELCQRNKYREDVYVRPIAYKSQLKIGLGLTGIESDFCMYMSPFGNYLDVTTGIKVGTSSWVRVPDDAVPPRAKICGMYVNSSLAKCEALENGFDEAILLNTEGNVAEGSGENIFFVKDGKLVTPALSQNILEGITRATLIQLAKDELGVKTDERIVNKSELYSADEVFLCGTGAQVSPVISVDHRKIGDGKMGLLTRKLQKIYFEVAKGDNPKYSSWLTPVYK